MKNFNFFCTLDVSIAHNITAAFLEVGTYIIFGIYFLEYNYYNPLWKDLLTINLLIKIFYLKYMKQYVLINIL